MELAWLELMGFGGIVWLEMAVVNRFVLVVWVFHVFSPKIAREGEREEQILPFWFYRE